jgi:hypothetical protein
MMFLLKIVIVIAAVGLLHTFQWFKNIGRDVDEAAYASLKRIMLASEEYGYPPAAGPLLIVLTALLLTLLVTQPSFR